ncbi:transcriptional regulator [Streptomyces sp. CBMA291]|nr:transcriptional regulator [Streptomyces sp. CBMA291]MBD0713737.1 transcriptional regulator [Streptomyces sp. CBMA370]
MILASKPQSARAAREFVREFLRHHAPEAPESHVDAVILVTSELVTNAYRYGTENEDLIRVDLHAETDRTHIEVHDPTRRAPRRRPASDERNRGRGLIVLDALCGEAWGVGVRPLGKFVWAEVPWTA